MNKVAKSVLALSMLVPSVAFLQTTDHINAQTEKQVTTGSLNVRTGPGANYKIVDWLKKDQIVSVLKDNNGWDYVKFNNGKTGYVNDQYLKNVNVDTTSVSANSVDTRIVTAYRLTLRNGPGANYKAIDYLKTGSKVQVLTTSCQWVKVSINGEVGYVNSSYLTKPTVTPQTPIPSTVPSNTLGIRQVTAYTLTLRNGPSANNKAIGYLIQGTKVTVHSYNGTWANVTANGMTGYVNSSYLSGVNSSTTTAPPQTPVTSSPTQSNNGALKGKVIVIDPGHGGQFPGAQGYVAEEDVNLQIALKTRDQLQAMGAQVYMTRTSDVSCVGPGGSYNADLLCRPALAARVQANAFVSIHANSGDQSASGSESFWYNPGRGDQKLASAIANRIHNEIGMKIRQVSYDNLSVLRNNSVPSTLVETGFVTNKSDAAMIGDSTSQEAFAKAIAEGIKDFF